MLTLEEVRSQGPAKHPAMQGTTPHNDYPAENVGGAVTKEPCLEGCARVKLIKSINTNIPLSSKQGRLKVMADSKKQMLQLG